MFSDKVSELLPQVERIGTTPPADRRTFTGLLEAATRRALADDEIVALLNATADAGNRAELLEFASAYRRPHDREVFLLPPLYFSSICENACRYCGFRTTGKRLDLEEFEREVRFLVDLGFRSLELVSSQDPDIFVHADDFSVAEQRFHTEELLPYVRCVSSILRDAGGGMLTTNIPPLDVAALRELKEGGLDCFLVWQETFNPGQYEKLHVSHGPKGNQRFRIDSMENSRRAGIGHLAGAFLKGLYDWRKEEAVLYLFDRHLKETSGRGFSIVGTPRVKGKFATSRLIAPYRVSDEDYELNIALDRVLFDGILWLQTRESFERNAALMERYGAGVILTVLSSTAPGGYAVPAAAKAQFPVFKQDLDASVARLEALGLEVRFGWDASALAAAQRTTPVGGAAARG